MSNEKCTIYGLHDPQTDELRYVGKTTRTLEVRLRAHVKPSSTGNGSYLAHWIRSLVSQGLRPIIRPIEIVLADEQDIAERRWIAHFRELEYRLVNYTDGGTGGNTHPGKRLSVEHAAALHAGLARARAEGRIQSHRMTDKERRNLSQKRMGMKFTDEHRANISKGRQGITLSEEHRKKIGAAHKGRVMTEEHRRNIGASRKGLSTPEIRAQAARARAVLAAKRLKQKEDQDASE